MRNPFTLIKNAVNFFGRKKIKSEQSKVVGTKKETMRSKGGGGSKKITADSVSNNDRKVIQNSDGKYELHLVSNYTKKNNTHWNMVNYFLKRKKKNRIRNKIARKSRRINRLKKVA